MKFFLSVSIALMMIIAFISCGKEKSFELESSTASAGTLKSSSGDCLPSNINGVFKAGLDLTSSNYIEVQIDVTVVGKYLITSDTNNGFSFKAEGDFTSPGLNTVRLIASGKPAVIGTTTFNITYDTTTCPVDVEVISSNTVPAVYTLSGAPGACTTPVISGTYQAGVALTSSNTIAIKVDVTTAGDYTLATNTVNGISFSGTGVLAAGAGQTITLKGNGTPTAAGVSTLKPQISASACTFDVMVSAAPPVGAGTFSCKIDGVLTDFSDRASASNTDGFGGVQLYLDGYAGPANGGNVPEFQIFITNINGSAVKTGSYNVDGLIGANGYRIEIDYAAVNADSSVTRWNTSSTLFPPPNPAFTVNVTSVTPTRVKGTFSGKVTDLLNGSTHLKTITDGAFDLPFK